MTTQLHKLHSDGKRILNNGLFSESLRITIWEPTMSHVAYMCAFMFFFTVVACFAMLAGHKDTARRVIYLHKPCNRNTKATQQTQTMQQKGQHACSKTCIWLSHALANCLCSIAPACRSHGAATSPKWLCSVIRYVYTREVNFFLT